jgi:hypothetical protein
MEDIKTIIEKWESHGLLDDSKNKGNLALGYEVLGEIMNTLPSKKIDRFTSMFPLYRIVIEKYTDGDLNKNLIKFIVLFLIKDYKERFIYLDDMKQFVADSFYMGIDPEMELVDFYCDSIDINEIIKKYNKTNKI